MRLLPATCLGMTALLLASIGSSQEPSPGAPAATHLFQTADRCQACHNGLITPAGEDVSIGVDWRASMMAHASRDPYWQAAVRREVMDRPFAQREIEHECSRCHMPMAHVSQTAAGGHGQVFAQAPPVATGPLASLAADGVSCTACHQIAADKLGTRESFTGHFVVDTSKAVGERQIFGPVDVDAGRRRLMHSATNLLPTEAVHVQSSELCATCHTLYTQALDASGKVIGELPEQMPYLEWRHSRFRDERSCQSCHMPVVSEPTPFSSTLGEPRKELSRHTFLGGNAWMLRLLNRYRDALGVTALPQDIERAALQTTAFLQRDTASIAIDRVERREGRLSAEAVISSRSGHKLPTGYPSRRAWVHLTVRDAAGAVVFESGAFLPDGRIAGNAQDDEPAAFEPHYREIRTADQVQIYESVMVDSRGVVTTGLLSGLRYVKDNRLLPAGFEKSSAVPDIAVFGDAAEDPDFAGGGDRLRYDLAVPGNGRLTLDAELLFQSIGYRWAHNLKAYPARETDRFLGYYEAMARSAAVPIARASAQVP